MSEFRSTFGGTRGCRLWSGARLAPGTSGIADVSAGFFTDGWTRSFTGSVADLGDWDGDGRPEIVLGDANYTHGYPDPDRTGRALVIEAGAPPGEVLVDRRIEGSLSFAGSSPSALLGSSVAAIDLDGDGRKELAAVAPGIWPPELALEGERRGRLAILHGENDFLGPIEGSSFQSGKSELTGGNRWRVKGSGLDARTEVLFDDTVLAVLERPDSRTLEARIPPWARTGTVRVRLRRGTDAIEFPEPFTYVKSRFPVEVDVERIGKGDCAIVETEDYFVADSDRVRGGHDFTGDGLGDLVFASNGRRADGREVSPSRIFLLPGSADLSGEIRMEAFEERGVILESAVPLDLRGYKSDLSAILVGDMTGDGRSELAISAAVSGSVYIIFGSSLPAGKLVIQDLLARGQGCRIEGFPKSEVWTDQYDAIRMGMGRRTWG